jgi:hypothetical protein
MNEWLWDKNPKAMFIYSASYKHLLFPGYVDNFLETKKLNKLKFSSKGTF